MVLLLQCNWYCNYYCHLMVCSLIFGKGASGIVVIWVKICKFAKNKIKKMQKIISMIVLLTVYAVSQAAVPVSQMRFANAGDTTEINRILEDLVGADKNAGKRALQIAERFVGRQYVAHTLEDSVEHLTINVSSFDCITFIETIVSLTLTSQISNPTWRDFTRYLESVRYRKGEMNGYVSRLHYVSEWITDNTYRGNIDEVTDEIGTSATMVKSVNYMSKHVNQYPALKDSATLAGIKNAEMGYRNHQITYLKKEVISKQSSYDNLRDGDIIVVLSKVEGLDASHVGLIKKIEGKPHLLHASLKEGRVVIDSYDLKEYFKRVARNSPGVRVLRISN